MKQLTTYFEVILKTSTLSRFSQTHLVRDESVLEHSGFVCMLCYFIATEIEEEGFAIDRGMLFSKAIVHDMDEIITGDIPRTTKYYNRGIKEALSEIEERNMKIIDNELGMHGQLFGDWHFSKEGMEGLIVELADALAIVYKAWQECLLFGNKTIIDHAANKVEHLTKINEIIKVKYFGSKYLPSLINEAIMICNQIEEAK